MPEFIWKQVSKAQAEAAQSLGFDVELRFYAQLPKGTKLPRGEVKGLTLSTSHRNRKRRPRNVNLTLTAKACEIREGTDRRATYEWLKEAIYRRSLTIQWPKAVLKEQVAKHFGISEAIALTQVSDLLRLGYLRAVEQDAAA